MIKYKNKSGSVGINHTVFARIAAQTAHDMRNSIILSNAKGRPVKIGVTGSESLGFIEVTETKNSKSVDIKCYLIVKMGNSISSVTKEFSDRIRKETELITGIRVNEVFITVNGVKSKKIAHRDVEIMC